MQDTGASELLRFTTAGSVDDGKSTLIGRLLYDSKSIYIDQYESIKATSERRGETYVNLALLTDGLKAEREQGITIDVAYRYFATPRRKFIIADTPGHIQYTRNMVTGASTAHLAIVLVDARHGVVEQTKRHSLIASLLGIPHIAVCINKMDLVDYSQDTFNQIVKDYRDFATRLKVKDIQFIPISALHGDNIVNRSAYTSWYDGGTLIHLLESVHIASDLNHIDARFPVQYVIRPHTDAHHDYRGYAGRLASGVMRPGDKVVVLPSGFSTTIKGIERNGEQLFQAYAPMSITITLDDEIDIARGDMIVRENNLSIVSQDIEAMICWMGDKPLLTQGKYALKHTTRDTRCVIKEVKYKLDINNLSRIPDVTELEMNEVGRISLRALSPLMIDPYTANRETGGFILIDEASNITVGAGMIL